MYLITYDTIIVIIFKHTLLKKIPKIHLLGIIQKKNDLNKSRDGAKRCYCRDGWNLNRLSLDKNDPKQTWNIKSIILGNDKKQIIISKQKQIRRLTIERSGKYLISLFLTSSLLLF